MADFSKDMMANPNDQIERALAYPFDIPTHSYVFVENQAYDVLELEATNVGTSTVVIEGRPGVLSDVLPYHSSTPRPLSDFVPILASGSNASPRRLAEKFGGHEQAIIPVLHGTVDHLCPVYSAHITRYGSVSATLQRAQGATANLFCLFLPPSLLETMHRSEFVGRNYGFFQLNGSLFHVDGRKISAFSPHAYLSLWGGLVLSENHIRLSAFQTRGVGWRTMEQHMVMEEVRQILSPTESIEDFILSNVNDDVLRKERISYLSTHHAKPISLSQFRRLD